MSVIIAPVQQSILQYLSSTNYSKVVVVVDENTRQHCYPLIEGILPEHTLIEVPSGEENKHLGTCEHIWGIMTDAQLDRHSLVINLGGGVIGDMGGFCAATYKRGIDFIQIPTTLLAQVDASVGGKLGVDFRGFKNHIGVLTQPQRVFIDIEFLKTLPQRELRSGFAEVIKHCLIRDAEMFEVISQKTLEEQDFETLITHSVEIKKGIVAEDPTEKGLRKILNFGHTIGHAIETFYLDKGEGRLFHGEAIAIGMIAETHISHRKNLVNEQTLELIKKLITKIYGKTVIPIAAFPAITIHTQQDKKNRGAEVRCSLVDGIGSCLFDVTVTPKDIIEALSFYNE
jgi:3-dehydroquinate synthase